MQKEQLIEKLFSTGAHFGYARRFRHPSSESYIFGLKGGTELFDLEKTAECFEQALQFIKGLATERKTVLFVGSKAEARETVRAAAESLNQPFCASRWIGGSLTNFSEIKKRLARLSEIVDERQRGEMMKFTKKERLLIEREAADLERMFGGLKGMQKLPDALVVVDPKHEEGAVSEAAQLNIPIVALLNSDCDRSLITHPIPGNDASAQTIQFVLSEIANTYSANVGASRTEAAPQQ